MSVRAQVRGLSPIPFTTPDHSRSLSITQLPLLRLLEAEPLGVLPSGGAAEEETPRERDRRTGSAQI